MRRKLDSGVASVIVALIGILSLVIGKLLDNYYKERAQREQKS
jgi:hypothetical protein